MPNFSAVVTLDDGREIDVEYPADAPDPNAAALAAAAKKLGVVSIPSLPRIQHSRDEVVKPSLPSTT